MGRFSVWWLNEGGETHRVDRSGLKSQTLIVLLNAGRDSCKQCGTQWSLSTLRPGQGGFPLRSLFVGGIVTVLAPPHHQWLAIALLVQPVT